MSGALEKWRGNLPVRLEDRIEEWRRRRAEEGFQTQPAMRLIGGGTGPLVHAGTAGELVELLRVCAIEDRFWIARYVKTVDGRLSLGETVRITESLWRGRYKESESGRIIELGSRSDEECAWCGATCRGWNGPITCSTCHAKVCFGRTTADNYFHCRRSCTGHGQLRSTQTSEIAISPSARRPGNAGG
jgi:hypothetical protein